jgi:hypothetical protein
MYDLYLKICLGFEGKLFDLPLDETGYDFVI